jgi:diguanylate cyclase (GGDEF)-like protein
MRNTNNKKNILKTIVFGLSILSVFFVIRVILAYVNMVNGDSYYHISNDELLYKLFYQEIFFSLLSITIIAVILLLVYKKTRTEVNEVDKFAYTDGLTGLYNRHYLSHYIDNFDKTHREGTSFCVVFIDVDHFKNINDTYGHTVGDCVLKDISSILLEFTRDDDMSFRYGGEEFMIIFRNMKIEVVYDKIDFIREKIVDTKFDCVGGVVTFSSGISCGDSSSSVQSVIDEADKALYMAKERGRNCISVYPTKRYTLTLSS